MTKITSEHVEQFRQDVAAAFRAVSHEADVRVNFPLIALGKLSESYYSTSAKQLFLPMPSKPTKRHITWARGEVDALALKQRYHNAKIHVAESGDAGAFHDRLEDVRVEAIGALQMAGVQKNLKVRWQNRLKAKGFDKKENIADIPPEEVVALIAYNALVGGTMPSASALAMDSLGQVMGRRLAGEIKQLSEHLHDQKAFAKVVQLMVQKLSNNAVDEVDNEEGEEQINQDASADTSSQTPEDQQPFGGAQARPQPGSGDMSEDERARAKVEEADFDQNGTGEMDLEAEKPEYEQPVLDEVGIIYQPYTRVFDEVSRAHDLASPDELARYRDRLDKEMDKIRDVTNRLASKLQRKLMAKQERSWDFNMEEGLLDSKKFAQVIVDPTNPAIYKWERRSEFKDTVLTLLLDNSGSMRGKPITIAALCAEILARTMERCGVKVEILGFTTKHWKGGESRKQWEASGSPAIPGRLNDLQHIIYKDADSPWRKSKGQLGLMLKEGLLKENIDGEALLWAYERLMHRSEDRKILMMISDGAPVDDSTLSTNPPDYLSSHLKEVIRAIEQEPAVDLLAIGIGHNVTDQYSRSVMIRQVDELGDAMVGQLVALFDDIEKANRGLRSKSL
jgi:cobaltochelatase CobT